MRAREAAALARSLAAEASSSEVLARAMLRLAESCLELAAGGTRWREGHALVRDRGAFRWRESLARQSAAVALLLSEGLRDLAVHGGDAPRDLELAARAEGSAHALAQAIGGLVACEDELRTRLEAPRLAEIALAQRLATLEQAPVSSRDELRRLATDLDVLQGDVLQREQEVSALDERARALEARRAAAASAVQAMGAAVAGLQLELERLRAEEHALAEVRVSREQALAGIGPRIERLRRELGTLAADPRAAIAHAVQRALLALPADAFDRNDPAEER